MILQPDPNSSSHEGPHLVRPYDTAVFTVFWSASPSEAGWYWETSGSGNVYGPFRTSCLAYLDAKGELLPPVVKPRPKWASYNPRHLPSIHGEVDLISGVCWYADLRLVRLSNGSLLSSAGEVLCTRT